jgi:hypothetical protein
MKNASFDAFNNDPLFTLHYELTMYHIALYYPYNKLRRWFSALLRSRSMWLSL